MRLGSLSKTLSEPTALPATPIDLAEALIGLPRDPEKEWLVKTFLKLSEGYSEEEKKLLMDHILLGSISVHKLGHALELGKRDGEYNLCHAINSAIAAGRVTTIDVIAGNQPEFRAAPKSEANVFLDGLRIRHNPVMVFEDYRGRITTTNETVVCPGLSQCRATYIINKDTDRMFTFHSSLGMGQSIFRQVAELGWGEKRAFIVGHWSGIHEANLLKDYLGIPSTVVTIEDARTHVNVVYRPETRAVHIGYGNPKRDYFIGQYRF